MTFKVFLKLKLFPPTNNIVLQRSVESSKVGCVYRI